MELIKKINKSIYEKGLKDTIGLVVKNCCNFPKLLPQYYYTKIVLPKLYQEHQKRFKHSNLYNFYAIRKSTLDYMDLHSRHDLGIGAYSYNPGGPPILYSSCFVVLTKHLYNDLHAYSTSELNDWMAYIQQFQSDDGLFRDPKIDIPLANEIDWWGWRHLTLHSLMTLAALGGVAQKKIGILECFRKPGEMAKWVSTRNWQADPAGVSNEIQNYGTMLQYARDFQNQPWCQDPLDELFQWLDQHQDPKTGLWGKAFDTSHLLSIGVQTGYHLWLLYFYDQRPIQYVDKIIDSCLATQNRLGGFGVPLNSSACEDIDSIDTLSRFYHQCDYRRDDISLAMENALPWVLFNYNSDGGFVFRKGEALRINHDLMFSDRDESCIFFTWFRTLSLAYLTQVLSFNRKPVYPWRFLQCPGLQFWFHNFQK